MYFCGNLFMLLIFSTEDSLLSYSLLYIHFQVQCYWKPSGQMPLEKDQLWSNVFQRHKNPVITLSHYLQWKVPTLLGRWHCIYMEALKSPTCWIFLFYINTALYQVPDSEQHPKLLKFSWNQMFSGISDLRATLLRGYIGFHQC